MKKYLILLLSVFLALGISAKSDKTAKTILDKTAKTIKAAGDIEVKFKATTFKNSEEQGSLNGKIYLHGKQLHVESDKVMYWFDGVNLWTYVKANKEVNVSTPPFYDQQDMNPYLFLNLYKRGFDYELQGSSTLRGKDCYTVRLVSQDNKQKIHEMIVDIDKASYQPVCIRIHNKKTGWNRISILTCKTHQKYNDRMFRFNKDDFPGTEVIDLR